MSEKIKVKSYKKSKKEPKQQTLEAYEKNLKLNLEAKRKDFDNISTSIIPSQINLVKTYMWVTSLSFPIFILIFTTKKHIPDDLTSLFFYFGAVCAISIMFIALFVIHKTKDRYVANSEDNSIFANITQDEQEHTQGLLIMIEITTNSLKMVSQTVTNTGKYLRGIFILMFPFLFCMVTAVTLYITDSLHHMKGGENMAEESKLTRPTAPSQPVKQPEVLQANSRELFENKQSGHRVVSNEEKKQIQDENKSKK